MTDLSRIHVPTAEELAEMEAQKQAQAESMNLQLSHNDFDNLLAEANGDDIVEAQFTPAEQVIIPPESRNSPCPCGSGLKYKLCHGKI